MNILLPNLTVIVIMGNISLPIGAFNLLPDCLVFVFGFFVCLFFSYSELCTVVLYLGHIILACLALSDWTALQNLTSQQKEEVLQQAVQCSNLYFPNFTSHLLFRSRRLQSEYGLVPHFVVVLLLREPRAWLLQKTVVESHYKPQSWVVSLCVREDLSLSAECGWWLQCLLPYWWGWWVQEVHGVGVV